MTNVHCQLKGTEKSEPSTSLTESTQKTVKLCSLMDRVKR